jgi:hypothetical protein
MGSTNTVRGGPGTSVPSAVNCEKRVNNRVRRPDVYGPPEHPPLNRSDRVGSPSERVRACEQRFPFFSPQPHEAQPQNWKRIIAYRKLDSSTTMLPRRCGPWDVRAAGFG